MEDTVCCSSQIAINTEFSVTSSEFILKIGKVRYREKPHKEEEKSLSEWVSPRESKRRYCKCGEEAVRERGRRPVSRAEANPGGGRWNVKL